MLERQIERQLKQRIETEIRGAMCLKFESPGFTGVPDRMILLPGGTVVFVELKAPGKTERPRQSYVQKQFRALGLKVFSAVDSTSKIERVVEECKRLTQ